MTTQTETRPAAPATTPYERLGGQSVLRATVDRFYDLMEAEPAYAELRALHEADLTPMRENLTGFLTGWAGGPRDWFAGGKCVMSLHGRLPITATTASQWTQAMHRAIDDIVGQRDAEIAAAMQDRLAQMAQGMTRRAA